LATVGAGTLCVVAGSVFWWLCNRLSSSEDFFDTSLWSYGFVILPTVALLASLVEPKYPRIWAVLLVLPQAIATVLGGTLLHDAEDGASLWIAGLFFVGIQGVFSYGGGAIGSQLRTRSRSRSL
jgi:hypothetical protein